MTDGQQTDGGNVAGITTPTPTPNVTDAIDWKVEAESWKNRYTGQTTAMNKKAEEVKTWQQKFAAAQAELEGSKAESNVGLTEAQNKAKTFEQQLAEQTKKLADYERKEKIRGLIYTDDFKELAPDFETDKVFQFGVLTAAEQMDETALKESLANSLKLRKGRAVAAIDSAVAGGTPTPPITGNAGGVATQEQILEQIKALNLSELGTQKHQSLMEKFREARKKSNS